jgi:hypothetical protein
MKYWYYLSGANAIKQFTAYTLLVVKVLIYT